MGKRINVKRNEKGNEVRSKRSKQISKEDLEFAIEKFDNDKKKIAEYFGIGVWSLREQLKRNNLNYDKRVDSNKKRKITIPPKEELEELYYKDNLTLLDISKIYGVSNVTIKKWMTDHNICLLSHSETVKNKVIPKIIKTNREKYGVDYYYESNDFKEKSANTFMEKYGVPFHPVGNTSLQEIEVLNYFNSLCDGFKKTYMYGFEFDGYNENIKVAFEYCGLFWHTESNKGKKLHINKYEACKKNGIRLFTIFEDEWLQRNTQVKSFIKNSLGYFDNKIFARKTKLYKLDRNDHEAISFLNKYHIQGSPPISIILNHYALYYNGLIVSIFTVGTHHRNPNEIVISRVCIKDGYRIIGGSNKIFNMIKQDYINTNIKTWSDNRWTEGNLYSYLNFKLDKETKQDYSYVYIKGKVIRKSKQSMTKTNINASINQTEYEKALELGFDRIWDCGKKTWVYKN